MPTISLNDKKYQYYDVGCGDVTLLFLHGLMGSKETLYHYSEIFCNYRCIFIDFPAHNKLPSYSLESAEEIAKYVFTLIEYLKPDKLAIVGFSFGGLVGLELVKSLNQRYTKVPLILWAVPLHIRKSFLRLGMRFLINLVSGIRILFLFLVNFKTILYKIGLRDADIDGLRYFDYKSMKVLLKCFDKESEFVDTPHLFIYGTNDVYINDRVMNRIPHNALFQKVLIDNGGHFGSVSGRENAALAIKRYLKSCF